MAEDGGAGRRGGGVLLGLLSQVSGLGTEEGRKEGAEGRREEREGEGHMKERGREGGRERGRQRTSLPPFLTHSLGLLPRLLEPRSRRRRRRRRRQKEEA